MLNRELFYEKISQISNQFYSLFFWHGITQRTAWQYSQKELKMSSSLRSIWFLVTLEANKDVKVDTWTGRGILWDDTGKSLNFFSLLLQYFYRKFSEKMSLKLDAKLAWHMITWTTVLNTSENALNEEWRLGICTQSK